jgi:membrane fusion protein, multidrug efflux system
MVFKRHGARIRYSAHAQRCVPGGVRRRALSHHRGCVFPGLAVLRDSGGRRCSCGSCSDGRHWPCAGDPFAACSVHVDRRSYRRGCLESLGEVLMTEVRGIRKRPPVGFIFAIVVIGAAAVVWYMTVAHSKPSTDDASIDAEVIHAASEVGGRIVELRVQENSFVHRGDVLFRIDPTGYESAVAAAQAQVDVARAVLKTRQRTVSVEQSNADIAVTQIQRAQTNLALSARTEDRLNPLAEKGYVPKQQLDQAEVAHRDAATSLVEAQEQAQAAHTSVGDSDAAQASIRAAEAALAIAQKALRDTQVRAAHDGRVAGLTVSTGEVVAPSQSLFTLINTEEWYVSANFRETDLKLIHAGECVTAYSMIDRTRPLRGVVESFGFGVLADDKIDVPRAVPYVQPSLNWVRVAHRFPVRIRLMDPPPDLVRLGASAIVQVDHGDACR